MEIKAIDALIKYLKSLKVNCISIFFILLRRSIHNISVSKLSKLITEKINNYWNLLKKVSKINQKCSENSNQKMRKLRETLSKEKLIYSKQKSLDLGGMSSKNSENVQRSNDQLSRIFYLLSKNSTENKHAQYFMDKVELLIYKHGIRNDQLVNILQNMDLRFDIKQFVPSLKEDENLTMDKSPKKETLVKEMDSKIAKLETMMMLYRGDQILAPLFKRFGLKINSFQRQFFVNVRFFSKIAPFKIIQKLIFLKIKKRKQDGLHKILFYKKQDVNVKLLKVTLCKIKQRILSNSFKELYIHYLKELLKKQIQTKSDIKGKTIFLIYK